MENLESTKITIQEAIIFTFFESIHTKRIESNRFSLCLWKFIQNNALINGCFTWSRLIAN